MSKIDGPDAWTQTYTGKKFRFFNPSPDSIDILDIAHALSMMCRFNGHVITYYSVADHSMRVSDNVGDEFKLQALMHDASEAYVADLSRPIKKIVQGYDAIEEGIMKAISLKYGFDWPMSEEVKDADNRMLMTERRDLMVWTNDKWSLTIPPYGVIISPLSQQEAELGFLKRFHHLMRNVHKGGDGL